MTLLCPPRERIIGAWTGLCDWCVPRAVSLRDIDGTFGGLFFFCLFICLFLLLWASIQFFSIFFNFFFFLALQTRCADVYQLTYKAVMHR